MTVRALTTTTAIATVAAVAMATSPASAQKIETEHIDLESWNYQQLYETGFSAERLMDAEVDGLDGDEIGEVEDLVVTPGEGVTHVILETDAFLDIGDKHLRYPLEDVEIRSTDRVVANIDEEAIDNYTLFPAVDDEALAGRMWRISELIDDYAYLEGELAYGYVEDVILTKGGDVKAVVVDSDVALDQRGGPYALPFRGYHHTEEGFDPGADTYRAPYTRTEAETLEPFRYGRLEGVPTVAREDEGGGAG